MLRTKLQVTISNVQHKRDCDELDTILLDKILQGQVDLGWESGIEQVGKEQWRGSDLQIGDTRNIDLSLLIS